MNPWKMGFVGAITDDLAVWTGKVTEDLGVKTIGVPFLGSAKAISMMGQLDVDIESWDTQYICSLIINDLFGADSAKTNIEGPKLLKGWSYETLPYDDMLPRTAALVDYIANEGTGYERLALTTAIARCTYRGRLGEWSPKFQDSALWDSFQKRLRVQKEYIGMPATFTHWEDDFYKTIPDHGYDLLYVDPPKIITNSDVYSATFGRLNRMVADSNYPHLDFDRWSKYDYTGRMRGILDHVSSQYLMFIYTSDVRPGLSELRILLAQYGTIIDEATFRHRSRLDYGLLYERAT